MLRKKPTERTSPGPYPWRFLPCMLALTGMLLSSACSNDIIPTDATLRMSPEEHTVMIIEQQDATGRCLYSPYNHMDIPVVLQLSTSNGSPIGDATLHVYTSFAGNTYSGIPALALYDDANGNGVIDEDTELISGPEDDIAQVKTDKWSGSRTLMLRINLSCAFQGELFAHAAGVTGRAVINVSSTQIIHTPLTDDQGGEQT